MLVRPDCDSQNRVIVENVNGHYIIRPQVGIDLRSFAEQFRDVGLEYHNGLIGVPITFLDKYCPDQFEIVWKAFGNTKASSPDDMLRELGYGPHEHDRGGLGVVHGKRMYARMLIRRRCDFTDVGV